MSAKPSVFVLIGAELQALLQKPTPLAGGRVWRGRLSPLVKENQQAINIKLDKANGASGGIAGAPTDWATDYELECLSRAAADGGDATEAVDPLLVAIWERLSMASAVPELIALGVQDVLPDPRIQWDLGEGDTPLVTAVVSVRIIHRTRPGQLVPW